MRNLSVRGDRCGAIDRIFFHLVVALCFAVMQFQAADAQPARRITQSAGSIVLTDNPFASATSRTDLIVRALPPKTYPAKIDNIKFSAKQIVIKFHEGSAVRLRERGWVVSTDTIASPNTDRIAARGLTSVTLQTSIDEANRIVKKIDGAKIRPIFSPVSEIRLAKMKYNGQVATGRELADLNLYYFVVLQNSDVDVAARLIASLSENPAVEQVYSQPIPQDAADIPPTTTIDLTAAQGYTSVAPGGIDVGFARQFPGGFGDAVSIIDVEGGWNFDHEDLPGYSAVFSWHGVNYGGEHGTAVAGMLWGVPNGFGVTGIVPQSRMGWSSVTAAGFPDFIISPASAVVNAAADLHEGDIILIEQHMPDLFVGVACPADCNPDQCGYGPVEYFEAEFAAISTVIANGIIVVEAAGNGSMMLTGPAWDRTMKDSGAILVGASVGGASRTPACWTNNGARVDSFSWGGGVATLGFGDLKANGPDQLQWYTTTFSGTSSASPIVTGAAALIQSIRSQLFLPKLTSRAMRTLLTSTGTPQAPGVLIGTQPNLRAALLATLPDLAKPGPLVLPNIRPPSQAISGTVAFENRGPITWLAADHKVVCAWLSPSITSASMTQYGGAVTFGKAASVSWSTSAPMDLGAHTLRCDMLAGSNSIGAVEGSMIVAQPNQFNAQIVSFTVTKGNASIQVKNTGTQDWDLSVFGQLSLRTTGGVLEGGPPRDIPLPSTVSSGTDVTIQTAYDCEGRANTTKTATVRMALSGAPFGGSATRNIKCSGVYHDVTR